jgi:hypothetical protein
VNVLLLSAVGEALAYTINIEQKFNTYKLQPDQGNWKHITGPQFLLIMTERRDITNMPS